MGMGSGRQGSGRGLGLGYGLGPGRGLGLGYGRGFRQGAFILRMKISITDKTTVLKNFQTKEYKEIE